jgi:glycosyltransferase involved in cell wall biosynthesis
MATTDHPIVSVILPIRNEAAHIERCLEAVLNQDYPSDRMEVLVVDGMSTDGTREMVREIIARQGKPDTRCPVSRPPSPVILLDNPSGIVPTALNIGLRQACGEVIIRVDGHCQIARDYVRRCVEVLRETGADNVGGLQRAVGETMVGCAIALATGSPFGVGNARFHYGARSGWVDTVYLGAYRRGVFERVGLFDEEMVRNQDDEFNFRLIQAGGKIWLDPTIRSVYYCRPSLRGLWRQYFQYGFYKVRVIQKRRAIPSWRHLVPSAFVLGLAGSGLLAALTHQPLWAFSIALPYGLANSMATAWTARRDRRALALLPLAFATLHVAYGLGFLWGLWSWGVAAGPSVGVRPMSEVNDEPEQR